MRKNQPSKSILALILIIAWAIVVFYPILEVAPEICRAFGLLIIALLSATVTFTLDHLDAKE